MALERQLALPLDIQQGLSPVNKVLYPVDDSGDARTEIEEGIAEGKYGSAELAVLYTQIPGTPQE